MQANSPWLLLLLIPWGYFVWRMIASTARLQGSRKAAVITIRAIIMLLLIAIAAQLQPFWTLSERNVVFIADRSSSVQADEALGQWIAKAMAGKDDEDMGGIVTVGLDAAVERALSKDALRSEDSYTFRAVVNDQFTDLSQGLRLSSGLLQQAGGGRIVLLSDGAENAGSMLRQAAMLKSAGIEVDVVPITPPQVTDAAIESFDVPSTLRQGEKYNFEFTITSTTAGSGELRLYGDNIELTRSVIQLEAGENRFALQSAALDPGFHQFRAELFTDGDEREQNNEAYAFSKVSGPPGVLIVEGEPGSSANIEAAMDASFIRHETIAPERLSVELASYAAYDSIILHNVPATRIAEKPMEWIAKAVSDYGIGLVMIGGNDSFGLGGYFKTPVERALPVYMDLKGKRQIPSLGLVLVIDRSGSMSDGKLELAKEAAMRTVELLREEDTVGVVAFDSSPWWVVEPTKLTNREDVISKIQGIQPEGGTEIFTAVQEAYNELLEMQTQRKHIILLTDGQSASNPGYKTLTDAMVEKQMTMSTVAVGDGADQTLLQQLAKDAKGRYYFTKDESTLPAIFSRETVMMSRAYIVEQTFTPQIGQAGDWSALWKNGIPQLNAYVATTAKETAEVALLSPEGDPILARWPYGSGRAVAWTSDMTGRWSREWTAWPEMPKMLTEWIKWTFPQFESTPYSVQAELEGRKADIRIRAEGGEGDYSTKLTAVINNAVGDTKILEPVPVAPGEYKASLPINEPGVYLMRIGGGENAAGGAAAGTTAGFVIPYSPEYRLLTHDNGADTLKQLAEATGGSVLAYDRPQDAFGFAPERMRQRFDWSRHLFVTALLLLLLDIAMRRLSLPWTAWGKWLHSHLAFARKQSNEAAQAASSASVLSVSRLQQRKSRAASFFENDNDRPAASAKENVKRTQEVIHNVSQQETVKPQPTAPARHEESDSSAAPKPDSNEKVNRLLAAKNRTRR
ncbi:VWA domain-containing protein [Paenibacillus sp. NEAU-GSW1]|uniref:VWA domain-containing protein n=1 Tax=Paenibacillus sp. NEAU-GSW1 TaxID=2682486 RepID=UPI0020A67140|nr:VWA domain-containing protein [Paenibacillus sp. NEAU-GSW1]